MKVIIIGAGIGGTSAGIALRRLGHDVVIYDRMRENKPVGAALSLWSNGVKVLNWLGLRDEVAALANISTDYYLRLEQGRGTRPSDQVLHALAKALGLDDESRLYLFRLAAGEFPDPAIAPDEAAARIGRILGQWTQTPAYVSDSNRDIVASNPIAPLTRLSIFVMSAWVSAFLP